MKPWEDLAFPWLLAFGLASAAVVFCSLLFITAPYGRHARAGWGRALPARLGWVLMELPSAAGFALWFVTGAGGVFGPAWVFLLMWELHYLHRSLVFPFRLPSGSKPIPAGVVLMGITFNLFNTYINGRYLGAHATAYTAAWLVDPRFLIGAALFLAGMAINFHADQVLFALRRNRHAGYGIPRGGLYRWISCPNYFGEILEWSGWALATCSIPGLVFVVWTVANLAPRALSHHRWYRRQFPDYPAGRRALIPGLL